MNQVTVKKTKKVRDRLPIWQNEDWMATFVMHEEVNGKN